MRVFIRRGGCSACGEDSFYYINVYEGGTCTWEYEGCGGYQGRSYDVNGEVVPTEEAKEKIQEALERLREDLRETEERIQAAQEALKLFQ